MRLVMSQKLYPFLTSSIINSWSFEKRTTMEKKIVLDGKCVVFIPMIQYICVLI